MINAKHASFICNDCYAEEEALSLRVEGTWKHLERKDLGRKIGAILFKLIFFKVGERRLLPIKKTSTGRTETGGSLV